MKRLWDWLRRILGGPFGRKAKPSTNVVPVRPPALGLNIHEPSDAVVAWARSAGCSWVRTTFYVHRALLEPEWYRTFLTGLRTLKGNGMKVCVVVHQLGDDVYGAQLPFEVRDLVTLAVDAIDAVQLGNELNDVNRWSPFLHSSGQYARGQEYARLYQECRDAVRSVKPSCPVVVAGIVGEPTEFLAGIKDGGCIPDRIACHVYGLPLSAESIANTVAASRRVFPTVPVWITEVGSEGGRPLDAGGDVLQDDDMRTALATLATLPDVTAFWFVTSAANDPGNALLREDGGERPAATRYRESEKR